MTEYETRDLTRQTAAILRGLVAKYDVSQGELALAANISQSQVSKILRGVKPIDIDQLSAMCSALGVDASSVLSEAEGALNDFDYPAAAKFVYVEDGLRLAKPWDTSRSYELGAPVIDIKQSRRPSRANVGAPTHSEDLHSADLRDDLDLAASDDDTAVDPDRGTV